MLYDVTNSNIGVNMENIILGLLMLQSRTIYQLRKRVNEGLNLMYSCSMGSIQAAIKKLLKNGYISVSEISEKGKLKKLYSITDKGQSQFDLWINSSIKNNSFKNSELAKIYFMGFSQKSSRIKTIETHIAELRKIHCELESICKNGELALDEIQENDILFYQLKTAEYGRDILKFNIDWYERLLADIRSI